MSNIQMINPTIQVNGKPFEGKLKQLGQGVSVQQAKDMLDVHKDGYDTIGVRLEGKDYLLLTKDAELINKTDQMFINGKRVQMTFFEHEDQTPVWFGEKIGGALGGGLLGTAFGAAGGFVVSMAVDHAAPMGWGAAIGGVFGLVAGFMGPEGMRSYDINETITDSLTDKFVTAKP